MVAVEATGPQTRLGMERTVGPKATVAPSADAARSMAVRVLLLVVVVATVGWLVAAPSTPALIAVVSAVIVAVGWGSSPDDRLSA